MVKTNSIISDDEPLYDSVCSDEDYASIGDNTSLKDEKLEAENNKPVTTVTAVKEVGCHLEFIAFCFITRGIML